MSAGHVEQLFFSSQRKREESFRDLTMLKAESCQCITDDHIQSTFVMHLSTTISECEIYFVFVLF